MPRYTATQARQNFAGVLDQAAKGRPVTIERGKLRFRIVLDEARRRPAPAASVIEILDPAVDDGNWTWQSGKAGLLFKPRSKV
jgi:antitoxin (DNA-binding transcriptional repressor) of toxin-antitoxin stability system